MASSERDVAAVPAPGLSAAAGVRAAFDAALVLEVLEQLVGAHGEQDVAAAALPPLLRVPGVRAAAVVVRERASAVVVGSAGYDCGSMAPGAALPLDAGLPVTEALRRRTVVVQGTGPSWVAVPFSGTRTRTGALLVSLDAPPPGPPPSCGGWSASPVRSARACTAQPRTSRPLPSWRCCGRAQPI